MNLVESRTHRVIYEESGEKWGAFMARAMKREARSGYSTPADMDCDAMRARFSHDEVCCKDDACFSSFSFYSCERKYIR